MVGVVVITHGPIAEPLVRTAAQLAGALPAVGAVGIAPGEAHDAICARVQQAARATAGPEGVLFLVDVIGSTPYNVCVQECAGCAGEVLSGVNLPMLLKLETVNRVGVTPTQVGEELKRTALRSIRLRSEAGAPPRTDPPPPPDRGEEPGAEARGTQR